MWLMQAVGAQKTPVSEEDALAYRRFLQAQRIPVDAAQVQQLKRWLAPELPSKIDPSSLAWAIALEKDPQLVQERFNQVKEGLATLRLYLKKEAQADGIFNSLSSPMPALRFADNPDLFLKNLGDPSKQSAQPTEFLPHPKKTESEIYTQELEVTAQQKADRIDALIFKDIDRERKLGKKSPADAQTPPAPVQKQVTPVPVEPEQQSAPEKTPPTAEPQKPKREFFTAPPPKEQRVVPKLDSTPAPFLRPPAKETIPQAPKLDSNQSPFRRSKPKEETPKSGGEDAPKESVLPKAQDRLETQTRVLRIGTTPVQVRIYRKAGQSGAETGVVMVNVHDDEKTAVEAGKQVLSEKGGVLIELHHTGERFIKFQVGKGKANYYVDPNNIFGQNGVKVFKNTIDKKIEADPAVWEAVRTFGNDLLHVIDSYHPKRVLALHNVDPGREFRQSIESYLPDSERTAARKIGEEDYSLEARQVQVAPGQDPMNFFFVTSPEDQKALAQKGYNVVLQDGVRTREMDKGSLSAHYEGMSYINIEARKDNLAAQAQMIKTAYELPAQADEWTVLDQAEKSVAEYRRMPLPAAKSRAKKKTN